MTFDVADNRRNSPTRCIEPAFMFIGCSDNRYANTRQAHSAQCSLLSAPRISSGAIFNAPVGSIVSQNNIGNQYSEKDLAT